MNYNQSLLDNVADAPRQSSTLGQQMKRTLFLLHLLAATATAQVQPPPSEMIRELFGFPDTVNLQVEVSDEQELRSLQSRKESQGTVARFKYSDPKTTSQSISIHVCKKDTAFGERRGEMIQALREMPEEAREQMASMGIPVGVFPASDGREIYQFLLGFGPGGSAYGALLESRDGKHELVVTVVTDGHDEEDAKSYLHHVAPKNSAKDAIEMIDALIVQEP